MQRTRLESALNVADLCLRLGQEYRLTEDVNGKRESVATHTTMLALLALGLSEEEQAKGLNMALVLAFALVHDLPEALTGDVPTFVPLDESQQQAKDENEAAARRTIKAQLGGSFCLIYELMELYERQDTPEARFVKILDKAMPKLVRALSGKGPQVPLEVLQDLHRGQRARLTKVAGQWGGGPQLALEFYNEASKHCEETWSKS